MPIGLTILLEKSASIVPSVMYKKEGTTQPKKYIYI